MKHIGIREIKTKRLLLRPFTMDDVDSDSAEVGAALGSKWWGKGYITEAVTALIEFGFLELGLHRIFASHHEENLASGRVLEKCGMKREGIMRGAQKNKDGSYSDLVLYDIVSK